MATDGPTPPSMADDIAKDGSYVLLVGSWVTSNRFETWVRHVAEVSGQRVDWQMYAGRHAVKYLGDRESVVSAIRDSFGVLENFYRESQLDAYGEDRGWNISASWLDDDGTLAGPFFA